MSEKIIIPKQDEKSKERDRRFDLASEVFDVVDGLYMIYPLLQDEDDVDANQLIIAKVEKIDDLLDLPLNVWLDVVDDASRIEANLSAETKMAIKESRDKPVMADMPSGTVIFTNMTALSDQLTGILLSETNDETRKYDSYHGRHLTQSEIIVLNGMISILDTDDVQYSCICDVPPIPRFSVGCYKSRPDVICIIDKAGDNADKITICPPLSYTAASLDYCGFVKPQYVDLINETNLGKPYEDENGIHKLVVNDTVYSLYKFAANTLDAYDTRGCAHYERKRAAATQVLSSKTVMISSAPTSFKFKWAP